MNRSRRGSDCGVRSCSRSSGKLKRKGLGILVTDPQCARGRFSIVDRAYLICAGKVEVEGTSEFLINDPKSRELYLGPRFLACEEGHHGYCSKLGGT